MFDLIIERRSDSVKPCFLRIDNCDKDGTIVAIRLASCLDGVTPTRSLKIKVDRETDESYLKDMGDAVVKYYDIVKNSRLLNFNTIVISSVHRFALYLRD